MAFTGVMPAVDYVAPRYGLEAGATVIKHGEDDQTWGSGFSQENGLCGIEGQTWVWCGTDAEDELTDGGLDPQRFEPVHPFLVQATDLCAESLSARRPDSQTRLLKVLDYLSVKGAERELWSGVTNDLPVPPTAPDPPEKWQEGRMGKALIRLPDPANLVGTGLSAKMALARVEDAMACCLPGVQGTIHFPPAVASLLDSSLQDIDGDLYTLAGSRVIVGAGYACQPAVEGGTHDPALSAIYGTGPVIAHFGPTSMVTDELAQMADARRNQFTLRAERLVAVTFDGCCHVGATVSLT